MSTLDKLIERVGTLQRPDDFGRPDLYATLQDDTTGRIEPAGFATQKERSLSLIVTVNYWANDAQRSDARRAAECALAALVYGDFRMAISRARSAVQNGDRNEAMHWLSYMNHLTEGGR